ncbi:hypothetical protein [Microseira sp. BLCC-F43]|uniref:hypothetical protein n=1 Tax=Microseira sp. BLCC-F43 TaxID=3153602 RepID=UPI0035B7E25F
MTSIQRELVFLSSHLAPAIAHTLKGAAIQPKPAYAGLKMVSPRRRTLFVQPQA